MTLNPTASLLRGSNPIWVVVIDKNKPCSICQQIKPVLAAQNRMQVPVNPRLDFEVIPKSFLDNLSGLTSSEVVSGQV